MLVFLAGLLVGLVGPYLLFDVLWPELRRSTADSVNAYLGYGRVSLFDRIDRFIVALRPDQRVSSSNG